MTGSENWRTETNASDYFGHQQKKNTLADRRPVVRRPSDLVGPGIGAQAVRLSDYNDPLATFNGFFSDDGTALNSPLAGSPFVGHIISDPDLGGVQIFARLDVDGWLYQRRFVRNPSDPNKIYWQLWVKIKP